MSIIGLDQVHVTLMTERTGITGLEREARLFIGQGIVVLSHLACLGSVSHVT
jgi:hypothetical protein